MQAIKNIIFDLGGVFININYPKTEQAFINLGITNFPQLYNQHHASSLFEDLETGKISPENVYEKFREISGIQLTNQQIQDAWNAMLEDFLLEELTWLEKIKNKYNIFLYSNTNQIHYDFFTQKFRDVTGNKNFDDYFIKAYYSHTLGLRKPYPASFTAILQEQNLVAQETLFIDDTISNIDGAKLAGLQTIHLIPPARVSKLGL
jgi:glucose-1-phosphatase